MLIQPGTRHRYKAVHLPSALCSQPSTLCSLISTLCSLPCTLYILSSKLCSLRSTLCSLTSKLYSLTSKLCSLPSTLCSLNLRLHFALHDLQFFRLPSALYSLPSALYTLPSELRTLPSALCRPFASLFTRCTLPPLSTNSILPSALCIMPKCPEPCSHLQSALLSVLTLLQKIDLTSLLYFSESPLTLLVL
jgi:hypothetical protein